MRTILTVLVAFFITFASPVQSYDPKVDQKALQAAFEQYTKCQKECAAGLASKIFNESVDQVLEAVGVTKGAEEAKDKKFRVLMFYAFARSMYERGQRIIGSYAACAATCDALDREIVALGRAGLLGPLLRNEKVNVQALENPRVFDAYMKYIKPVPLPAEERSKEWWKHIQSLS